MKKCVIFAAAPLGSADYIKIEEGTMVICADAGVRSARVLGITPDLALGDFDSMDKSEALDIPSVTFPKRKDDTDLMLAVKYGMQAGCEDFTIYGALGGNRLDHTFAAFSTLAFLADNELSGCLVDDKTCIRVLSAGVHIVENLGGYLSLFPFGCDKALVSLEGTEYDGEALLINSFPLGVSNEIKSDVAKIEVFNGEETSRVLMIQTKN